MRYSWQQHKNTRMNLGSAGHHKCSTKNTSDERAQKNQLIAVVEVEESKDDS
jgi:hypothetical protein